MKFRHIAKTLGMWTSHGTVMEACAFINGFDAGAHGALLAGFRPWLVERTQSERPELAWTSLVFEYAFQTIVPTDAALPLRRIARDGNNVRPSR